MPHPSSPASSSATAEPSRLAPGATFTRVPVAAHGALTLYLPPGHALLCVQGRVDVRMGPAMLGHVLHSPARRLDEGQALFSEADAHSRWLRLDCPGRAGAQLLIVTPAPRPSWIAAALRRALAALPRQVRAALARPGSATGPAS